MKRNFTLLAIVLFFLSQPSFSQYCMLPGQTPYSPLQPGITNFKLNTINRTSGNSESSSAVVVTTGQTTTLTAGQTYTISITHSEDSQFFPGARNNLRVWLDLNNNFSYLDAGETILTKDLEAPGTTYTATYTLPLSTPNGTYSLRATAKMSADAGHTLPTPCNVPADQLGYHGEMEDYTVIVGGTNPGQAPVANFQMAAGICKATVITLTNTSSGTPVPTYSWSSNPAGAAFSPNSTAVNPQVTFTASGSYSIICAATNSVSSNSIAKVIVVSGCTGINTGEADHVSIGPNPAGDFLNITTSSPVKSIGVINCLGEIVAEKEINEASPAHVTFDLAGIANGIYFVKINSTGNTITRQIIISR